MSNKYLRAFRNTLTFVPEKTPYCGTCHKAGRSQEEYTSHWTRRTPDPNSEIVCPLILESVCSNCKSTGHWRKYCPEYDIFSHSLKKDRLFLNSKKYENEFETKQDIILEDYRSSEDSDTVVRPQSPDFPPPWLEEKKPEPIKKSKSWAEIVGQN
jgi:hypothetical protein